MMPNKSLELLRLKFNSPLHLAKGKSDYVEGFDVLHSDTLKAALLAVAVELYGDDAVVGQDNFSCPWLDNFHITSGFTYWNDEFFFPKPLGVEIAFSDEEQKTWKKLNKNIRFVGKSIFEEILNGKKPEISSSQLSEDGEYASKVFAGMISKDRFVTKSVVEQRVVVPRATNTEETADDAGDAKPYYLERAFFREGAGLFFLLDCTESTHRKQILQCLEVLGENGIGLDRSTGNGHFEVLPPKEIIFNLPTQSDRLIALSLFCPDLPTVESKDFLSNSHYNLCKRGGWVTSSDDSANLTFRKKSVYMFCEGSVFPDASPSGKLVNLRPAAAGTGHPMWRDGRPIFLPMKSHAQPDNL